MLKEHYGEHTFRRALEIVEKFEGDRYLETNEKRIIKKLKDDIFKNNDEQAALFLH